MRQEGLARDTAHCIENAFGADAPRNDSSFNHLLAKVGERLAARASLTELSRSRKAYLPLCYSTPSTGVTSILNSNGPPMAFTHRMGSANGIRADDLGSVNCACCSS